MEVNNDEMNTFSFLAACLGAYLIGSIPFGLLIARTRGIDIRQVGSGNIGSTNITRALGFRWGLVVAILDASKAYFPALAARQLFPNEWQILVISLMSVIGHIFSFWMGFKGGKGVAATFGLLAFYFGLPFFAFFLAIWYLTVKWVKLMSLVNLGVGLLLPLAFWLKYKTIPYVLLGVVLCGIIWWSHRENIKRLLKGKELPTNY